MNATKEVNLERIDWDFSIEMPPLRNTEKIIVQIINNEIYQTILKEEKFNHNWKKEGF